LSWPEGAEKLTGKSDLYFFYRENLYVFLIRIVLYFVFFNGKSSKSNTSLTAPEALTHRLQHRTAFKIQNGPEGSQNGRQGLMERGFLPSTFDINKFLFEYSFFVKSKWRRVKTGGGEMSEILATKRRFRSSTPSMWKVADGVKKKNVIASWLPERQPSAMPTTCAKMHKIAK